MASQNFGWRVQSIVMLVASCALMGAARAEDFSQNRHAFAENAGSADDRINVSDVFEARWAEPATEYVLDRDGSLKQIGATSRSLRKDSQLGNVSPHSGPAPVNDDYSDTDMFLTDEVAEQPSAPDHVGVPECGPAPIDPAGIKALVEEAANRNGVDPAFAIAVVAIESNFDRDRNSPKGARGPMQLMPATAARFGVNDVCDPIANIDGGVRYLRTLLDEFGNPLLAAAAYNAGEHRIYDYGGIPPFTETVSYVAKVVNHQLGLPMPSARKGKAPRLAAERTPEVGVIEPRKTGSFVAGVMHF